MLFHVLAIGCSGSFEQSRHDPKPLRSRYRLLGQERHHANQDYGGDDCCLGDQSCCQRHALSFHWRTAPQEYLDIPTAVEYAQNQRVTPFDSIKNDVLTHGESAHTGTKIVAPATGAWMRSQQPKARGDGLDQAVCSLKGSRSGQKRSRRCRQCPPGLAEQGDGPSALHDGTFGGNSTTKTLFRFFGERLHGLLGDGYPFTPGQRGVGFIERREDFESSALALFPQQQRLLHGFSLAGQPAARDRLPNEGPLVRRQLDVHETKVEAVPTAVKGSSLLDAYARWDGLDSRSKS